MTLSEELTKQDALLLVEEALSQLSSEDRERILASHPRRVARAYAGAISREDAVSEIKRAPEHAQKNVIWALQLSFLYDGAPVASVVDWTKRFRGTPGMIFAEEETDAVWDAWEAEELPSSIQYMAVTTQPLSVRLEHAPPGGHLTELRLCREAGRWAEIFQNAKHISPKALMGFYGELRSTDKLFPEKLCDAAFSAHANEWTNANVSVLSDQPYDDMFRRGQVQYIDQALGAVDTHGDEQERASIGRYCLMLALKHGAPDYAKSLAKSDALQDPISALTTALAFGAYEGDKYKITAAMQALLKLSDEAWQNCWRGFDGLFKDHVKYAAAIRSQILLDALELLVENDRAGIDHSGHQRWIAGARLAIDIMDTRSPNTSDKRYLDFDIFTLSAGLMELLPRGEGGALFSGDMYRQFLAQFLLLPAMRDDHQAEFLALFPKLRTHPEDEINAALKALPGGQKIMAEAYVSVGQYRKSVHLYLENVDTKSISTLYDYIAYKLPDARQLY